jgi:hypothetical protein
MYGASLSEPSMKEASRNTDALAAFIARKTRLSALSAEHLHRAPDDVS